MKHSGRLMFIIMVISLSLLVGCMNDISNSNNPPAEPSNPFPEDNATNVSITPTLSWSCNDPDGDSISYDIYFGTDPNPPLVKKDHPITNFMLDTLQNETTYYWKIVAKDSKCGVAQSPIWKFTTSKPARLKWKFKTYDSISSSGPAIGFDNTIYVGSEDFNLYAVNPDSTLKWKYNVGIYVRSLPTVDSSGTIYLTTPYGLYAINPNGTLKWYRDQFLGDYTPSPVIGDDGTIYIGGAYGFFAINPDGSTKWVFSDGRFEMSNPAIGPDGTIYIGSYDTNYLYAINPDGTLKWKFETNYFVHSSPAIDSNGIIYVGSNDDNLYAINPDGTLKWKFETGDDIDKSPIIGSDETIYIGSKDGYLYAINSDGTLKWKFKAGNWITTSPIMGSNGIIYVVSSYYLYAINSDGTLKWKYTLSSVASYSTPAIGSDGTIYITDWDGYLYAIESDSLGLANSSWPKFQKNNRNTGNFNDSE
ncbi:PQQ-binding-like beta-propeller repeat protein [Thermosipho sp. 1244]|uniref:outer membrane protein assembly factor BamB family protein n=1 Tax=Thermosipho sp. 1244 TaxID=1755816 RepID=UPI001BDE10CE